KITTMNGKIAVVTVCQQIEKTVKALMPAAKALTFTWITETS
ncbi:17328_t:CDS:2, partial [Gigaspora rosea]